MRPFIHLILLSLAGVVAAACKSSNPAGPSRTGTVAGTVISSLGGGLSGARVVVETSSGSNALPAVTTSSSGNYTVTGVPIGNGAGQVTVSALPMNCMAPSPAGYSDLTPSGTVTVNVSVQCTATGSLTVTVTTPAGVRPWIRVSGPAGYSQPVTATTTLTNLPPGTYTVAAATDTVANAIVNGIYSAVITGSPVALTVGATDSASVTYSIRSGTGGLWVANYLRDVVQIGENDLTASGSPGAALGIVPAYDHAAAVAVDGNGNLWVAFGTSNVIAEYTPAQVAAGGFPTAVVTIFYSGATISAPFGIAFDGSGNLWVSNYNTGRIVEFTSSQLAASGAPTPALTITSTNLTRAAHIAFDKNGTLWVANTGDNSLASFTPAQQSAGGSQVPSVTIGANAASLSQPFALAFDPNGDLWVSNLTATGSTIVEFTPAQLTATGNPTPAVTITEPGIGVVGGEPPKGLAFDNDGNLWVANSDNNEIVMFTHAQLTASGALTPVITLTSGAFGEPTGIAFDPHAANLPLH